MVNINTFPELQFAMALLAISRQRRFSPAGGLSGRLLGQSSKVHLRPSVATFPDPSLTHQQPEFLKLLVARFKK
jgi:hypothetical protein